MTADFLTDVKKLKKEEGIFYFFKKGGMYYAIENNAEIIASRYLRSVGSLKENTDGIPFVMISEPLYISLLRDLLLYDRKSIELYEFDINKWKSTYEASPGNIASVIDLINDNLDISKSSMLLAISVNDKNGQYEFDAACCDSTLFTIATTTFIDSSPSLVYYENLINQTMPSEIIFCEINPPLINTLKKITDEYQIPYRETKLKGNTETGQFPKTKSVKALLSNLTINIAEFKPKEFELNDFMTIDHSASSALNVFPEGQTAPHGLPTSLYQLLNECVTPMGSRLLHQYLQQPLLDKEKINQRLSMVSALISSPEVMISVRDSLKQVPDIARLTRKFLNGRANLQDCVRMHDIAIVTPKVMEIKNANCSSFAEFAAKLEELEADAEKVVQLVQKTIDFKSIPQHIYRITPDFNEELREIADDMDEVKSKMEKIRCRVADEAGIAQDKVKTERLPNKKLYYLRVGRTLEKNIRNISSITIIETRSNGVHFTTPKFTELNDRYFELETSYNHKQREISQKLFETLKEYAPVFQVLNDVFAQIDVFISLAYVANSSPSGYVQPELVEKGDEIILEQARHPLVERRRDFIPNDIEMNRNSTSFIIISGPNSAGKSTLLKTVGICVFLAHIGSFVPCNRAVIPITASIHARVGAWDTPTRSTFTIEMEEMSGILQSARKESLIIVDELGRSTSCSDGFGLAWAISEQIAKNIGAFTLFATHFHELCNLEEVIPCVTNYHMDASSNDRLLMTYHLKKGPFPSSFGIDAAEKAGFPQEIMERAIVKEKELELADQEEGERPKRIVIDPNERYRNFLRKMIAIDTDNCSPAEIISICQEARQQFIKEKESS